MPPLGMISCATLQICNFRPRNPSCAINVSNIPGGSEKCGGLTRVIRWPPLIAREVSRPTEKHGPHFLHKPDSFPLGTQRLHQRCCCLQAAAGEACSKNALLCIAVCFQMTGTCAAARQIDQWTLCCTVKLQKKIFANLLD